MCSFISYCRDINTNDFDLALPKYPPQLNLSTTATFAIVERFKQESMYGLFAKKSGLCREVAVSEGSTVIKEYYGILWSGSSDTKGFISYRPYRVGPNLVR